MYSKLVKYTYLACGIAATTLGFIGLFLPLMPTTCFLILAVWAFSKSSPKLGLWILEHPQFGHAIKQWMEFKVISRATKNKINLSIVAGFFLSFLVSTPSVPVSCLLLLGMLLLLIYINTRAELNQGCSKTINNPIHLVVTGGNG